MKRNRDGKPYTGTKVETPETDKGRPKNEEQKLKETADTVEGRTEAKGNKNQRNTRHTQRWESAQRELELVHRKAKMDKKLQFTALMHHIYKRSALREAYHSLKRNAAPGVDEQTWRDYGKTLEENLEDLSERLKRGAYQAKPVKRAYIAKSDGSKRPLGITVLEDKIVQKATVEVMNAIYEADFLGFSYGYRPKRSQHQALYALEEAIYTRKVSWVFDADLKNFFNTLDHEWLIKFVEHRIKDRRVVRLIQKWLKAGVLEDGKIEETEIGVPQGGSISPLLANIYLHYVYDLWINKWRKSARGKVSVVRYADDTLVGFQYLSDAKRFQEELIERLKKFGLELNPKKTKLIEFGRYAEQTREKRGEGKPESFQFLGFTHTCGKARSGKFKVIKQTIKKKLSAKVKEVKGELRKRMHKAMEETGKWLSSVLKGHYQYYGVSGNGRAMSQFRYRLSFEWKRVLEKRSQRARITWQRMSKIIERWLPKPKIYHEHLWKRIGVIT